MYYRAVLSNSCGITCEAKTRIKNSICSVTDSLGIKQLGLWLESIGDVEINIIDIISSHVNGP